MMRQLYLKEVIFDIISTAQHSLDPGVIQKYGAPLHVRACKQKTFSSLAIAKQYPVLCFPDW